MEPTGRVYCLPFNYWNRVGGNPGSGLPDQPHHHPSYEGVEDSEGPQAPQDGQGDQSSAGHCYAGSPSGNHTS